MTRRVQLDCELSACCNPCEICYRVAMPSNMDTAQYTVGWGTLALLTAGLAQSKNRSGLAWFVGAIFFGPIATFILVAFCDKLTSDD